MHPLMIPELYAPFPARIHAHVVAINEATASWVIRFHLHEGVAFARYQREGLSWMTARFYPEAAPERLAIADKINTLLFAVDDLMDHNDHKSEVISSRDRFIAFTDLCLRIMQGETVVLPSTGHLAALADVWAQAVSVSTSAWQRSFTGAIRQMFDAALWAYDNVAAGRWPSAAEYYRMRPFLGAANTSTDMIEFCDGIKLPQDLQYHPVIAELTRLCQITVCLANDLFSLSKEMAHEDQHNMVVILKNEQGASLSRAIRQTVKMHNADVKTFIGLLSQLPEAGEHAQELRRYITSLTALMRGNIDWSVNETSRYSFRYQARRTHKRKRWAER